MLTKILAIVPLLILMAFPLSGTEKLSTEELIRDLGDADAMKRAQAADELGDRGEKLGLDALVAATTDADPKVQMAVVKAISKIQDPRQVSAMSTAVRNTKAKAQEEAVHRLTEIYIPASDRNALVELWATIAELFNPPHPLRVEPWIDVDQQAIDAIVFVLDDKTSDNRILAAATLGILRASPALPRLTFYLRSPNEKMVRTCVRSIGYIGRTEVGVELVPLLKHSDEEIVIDAVRVLGQFRYRPALSELQRFLDYTNKKEYRRVALQAISRIGDPSSETTMRKYYNSDDKELRQYAIEGIGRMGLDHYRDTLEKDFQREKSKPIRLALCFSLYALNQKAYIDTIVHSLDDRVYKHQARGYLVELGSKAVPDLAGYLKAEDKQLKIRIIQILGKMRQPEAIRYLEPYLKDQDLEVVQAATDAVKELKQIQDLAA